MVVAYCNCGLWTAVIEWWLPYFGAYGETRKLSSLCMNEQFDRVLTVAVRKGTGDSSCGFAGTLEGKDFLLFPPTPVRVRGRVRVRIETGAKVGGGQKEVFLSIPE